MTTARFKKWWLLLIKGFILIILACLIIFYPQESIVTISLFMGISLIVTGIVLLLISAELRKAMENWTMRLAEGLMDIVFGFFLLAHPDVSLVIIPILIGFIIAFNPDITIVSIGILIGVPVLIIGLANLFFAVNLRNLE